MAFWSDIDESKYKARILRYKADLEALRVVVRTLEGLPASLARHADLKSRCLIPIIEGT